jgi:hypothetical protein
MDKADMPHDRTNQRQRRKRQHPETQMPDVTNADTKRHPKMTHPQKSPQGEIRLQPKPRQQAVRDNSKQHINQTSETPQRHRRSPHPRHNVHHGNHVTPTSNGAGNIKDEEIPLNGRDGENCEDGGTVEMGESRQGNRHPAPTKS